MQSSHYWLASTVAVDTSAAWGVNFNVGRVDGDGKASFDFVWCVRGGQGVDPQ